MVLTESMLFARTNRPRGRTMTYADAATELRFDLPGPGFWEQDPVHFPRPLTRYWTEVHPAAFKRGTGDFARFYGMLIDSLEMAYVSGFGYRAGRPPSRPVHRHSSSG